VTLSNLNRRRWRDLLTLLKQISQFLHILRVSLTRLTRNRAYCIGVRRHSCPTAAPFSCQVVIGEFDAWLLRRPPIRVTHCSWDNVRTTPCIGISKVHQQLVAVGSFKSISAICLPSLRASVTHFVTFYRRYATLAPVLAVVVCLCLCLSHAGIVSKRLDQADFLHTGFRRPMLCHVSKNNGTSPGSLSQNSGL